MSKIEYNINQLSKKIYQQNVEAGWWEDPMRCRWQTLQLVSTEVSEATESTRKDLMDDHLPQYKGEIVELADALIRVLDFGGRYEYVYETTASSYPLAGPDATAGANHLSVNIALVDFVKALYVKNDNIDLFYSALVDSIITCVTNRGYTLNQFFTVLNEKLEVNKTRPDHKKENRDKTNGKKF